MKKSYFLNTMLFVVLSSFIGCSKTNGSNNPKPVTPPPSFVLNTVKINGSGSGFTYYGVNYLPVIQLSFLNSLNLNSVNSSVSLQSASGASVAYNFTSQNNDSTVLIQPISTLSPLTNYTVNVSTTLKSKDGGSLQSGFTVNLFTQIDSTDKFSQISDSALLDLVQQQTFKYFWNFGHPVSGLARERNNGDNETVTTGGSGFGIMAMVVAVNRGFITRSDAVARLNTITNFLTAKCSRWHGAFSHWINGSTGATVSFGNNNGADIVETSYLLEGLLTARQYFNSATDAGEIALRNSINSIWNAVEWNWFTQNGAANGLYWQYNPSYTSTSDIWSIPVTGWNEALITYVLAGSSPSYSISKNVYDNGWATNGAMKNGKVYYGITLPLGPNLGGPLFFEQYSFTGINPHQLSDTYCSDYFAQAVAHSQINYSYCAANPQNYYGYSSSCWGLTASDIQNGYTASSPTNDVGVIAPTAALSSMPYTPVQSMNALKFFYYKLGDKLWGDDGFYDAFKLSTPWFASSYLAIDEGPIICMIENYRSGLLWNLFMSCPEVKTGMKKLGFSSPDLN